jgi:WD domain, G-beta repeat
MRTAIARMAELRKSPSVSSLATADARSKMPTRKERRPGCAPLRRRPILARLIPWQACQLTRFLKSQGTVGASDDKTARVWDAATGKLLFSLVGHTGVVESAAFSPDGTRIVTTSNDKTARVWDAATGKPVKTLIGYTGYFHSAVFSSDGTRILRRRRTRPHRCGMPRPEN